jgi:hypothetical protein
LAVNETSGVISTHRPSIATRSGDPYLSQCMRAGSTEELDESTRCSHRAFDGTTLGDNRTVHPSVWHGIERITACLNDNMMIKMFGSGSDSVSTRACIPAELMPGIRGKTPMSTQAEVGPDMALGALLAAVSATSSPTKVRSSIRLISSPSRSACQSALCSTASSGPAIDSSGG